MPSFGDCANSSLSVFVNQWLPVNEVCLAQVDPEIARSEKNNFKDPIYSTLKYTLHTRSSPYMQQLFIWGL